jgi:uncharacterized pyridoxal phosphate-containing UPF0001 family protein
VQVSLDRPETVGRAGVDHGEVLDLAARIAGSSGLTLGGVMAVAPLGADPRPAFERLARIAAEVRTEFPAATVVSAGMSGDLEAAVNNGATHLRIGTALLGRRSSSFG